jgi:hypothetical protein
LESIPRQQDKKFFFDKNPKLADEDIDEKQSQMKNFLTSTPRQHDNRRISIVHDFYPTPTNKRFEHTQSNVKTIKEQSNINRQTNIFPSEPAILSHQGVKK